MSGDWIKMRNNLDTDPKVIHLAGELGIHELHAVGCLWKIWAWADQHSVDGNAISVTDVTLDRFTDVTGFANAMRKIGWLEGENGCISFPRFDEHNGETAKKRAQTASRVARNRARQAESGRCNEDVTQEALPEKRREEKNREEGSTPTTPKPPPFVGAAEVEAEKSAESQESLERVRSCPNTGHHSESSQNGTHAPHTNREKQPGGETKPATGQSAGKRYDPPDESIAELARAYAPRCGGRVTRGALRRYRDLDPDPEDIRTIAAFVRDWKQLPDAEDRPLLKFCSKSLDTCLGEKYEQQLERAQRWAKEREKHLRPGDPGYYGDESAKF